MNMFTVIFITKRSVCLQCCCADFINLLVNLQGVCTEVLSNWLQVLPGLYVGNYRDSKDPVQLEKYKITHILSIHDAARRLHSVSFIFTLFTIKMGKIDNFLSVYGYNS